MGATRFEAAPDEGEGAGMSQHFDMGYCRFSGADHRHLSWIFWVATNWAFDDELFFLGDAIDDSEILSAQSAGFELISEMDVDFVVFGDDHESGGVFIESMNDSGPEITTNCAEIV